MAGVPAQASLRKFTETVCWPDPKSPLKVKVWLAPEGAARRGERAAELLAVDRDGELRVALVGVLRNVEHQRVGAAAGDDGRDRRAVGHAEALGPCA